MAAIPTRKRAAPAVVANLIDVARLDQIAPGMGAAVTIADNAVAVFNVDGRIVAIDDTCVRCGASLAAGTQRGADVTCSGCDWRYDVITGAVLGVPGLRTETFGVTVVDSHVMVAIASTWPPQAP